MLNRIWWGTIRVCYFVDVIFWVAALAVRTFPPPDGNFARDFGGALALNTAMVVIAWAFIPWARPEFRTATKTRKPALPESPQKDLEEIWGQQTLEDVLKRRTNRRREQR